MATKDYLLIVEPIKLENNNFYYNFYDEFDKMLSQMNKNIEEKIFQDVKDQGRIDEVILIANPKHEGILSDALYQITGRIDVLWSSVCEEDKLYMITDKKVIKNIRENWKWRGNNDRNSEKWNWSVT